MKQHFDNLSKEEAKSYAKETGGKFHDNTHGENVNCNKAYTVTSGTNNTNVTQEHNSHSVKTGDYHTYGYSDEYWMD